MTDLVLTDETPLAQEDELALARRRAAFLLELPAVSGLTGGDRVLCERVAEGTLLPIWLDEVEQVEIIYRRMEREAALRGENWEGGAL